MTGSSVETLPSDLPGRRVAMGDGFRQRGGVIGNRPVRVQSTAVPPREPRSHPHQIVVGQRVRGGPRMQIEVEHLTAADAKVVLSSDWLPEQEEFAEQRAELAARRADLQASWERLRHVERDALEQRRDRLRGGDGEPVDPHLLRQQRQDDVVRAEIALFVCADRILGELREHLPTRLDEDRAHAASLTAEANRLRRLADAADRDARQLRAVVLWQQRALGSPIVSFSNAVTLTADPDEFVAPGQVKLPRSQPLPQGGV